MRKVTGEIGYRRRMAGSSLLAYAPRRGSRERPEPLALRSSARKAGVSILELLVALAVLAVSAAILMPGIARTREAARRAQCAGNLKQWGMVFHMFAAEHYGKYPGMLPIWPGMRTELLGPDMRALYPEYLTDPAPSVCTSDPGVDTSVWAEGMRPLVSGSAEIAALVQYGRANANCLLAHISMPRSYVYFGYAVQSGTAAEIAWQGLDEAGRTLREHYPALGAVAGGSGILEDFRLDMGDVCPYNGVFYSTDTGAWPGMFEVPERLTWTYGASGLGGGVPVTTLSGDVISAFASDDDRAIGRDATGAWITIPEHLYRLREGVERMFITDINCPSGAAASQSRLPVVMDGWGQRKRTGPGDEDHPTAGIMQFNHLPGGANVLYMDGHVRFVPFGSRFPVKLEDYGEGRNWHESIADGVVGG